MKKQTILIVDDESANISVLVEILDTKYNILVATDGKTALEIVNSEEEVDLILLDILMSKMDGYEVAHQLKHNKKTSKIPFIFLTAKSDSQSVVKGFQAGAVDYISKPFAKEELLARVHNHLQKKRDEKKIAQYLEIMDKNIISSSTDLDGTIVEVSEAFCKLTGYSREELIGKNHNILRHVDIEESAYKIMWDTIINNEIWKGEVKNRRKDGSVYWVNATVFPLLDDEDTKIGYMAIRQDITDKKRIEELSITDELTKLYNRRYFNEVFASELNRAKRENKSISFLMLDVDHFKSYNDTYGHQAGDAILSKIGEVLNTFSKRAGDFAFRLGGEEFGIIVHEDSPEEVTKFANNLLKAIEALKIPHAKNLVSEFVTVSIGLVYKNTDKTTTVETLYKEVDECLYRAKESGRNRVVSG